MTTMTTPMDPAQPENTATLEPPPFGPDDEAIIKAFVARHSKFRRAAVVVQFLKGFLEHTRIDKITEDAKSTFGSRSDEELKRLLSVTLKEEADIAAEYQRQLEERKAAEDARVAEAKAKLAAGAADGGDAPATGDASATAEPDAQPPDPKENRAQRRASKKTKKQ